MLSFVQAALGCAPTHLLDSLNLLPWHMDVTLWEPLLVCAPLVDIGCVRVHTHGHDIGHNGTALQ
jgi:hypothetical protein